VLDFKALKQTHQRIASQQQDHKDARFTQHFEAGLQALGRAHDERFCNKQSLIEACEQLIKAISAQREDIRPYLALSYLFTILEDFDTALEYLQAALHLDPQHEVALAFLDTIRAQRQGDPLPAAPAPAASRTPGRAATEAPPAPPAPEMLDLDALYDQIEQRILERIRAFSAAAPPQPAPDATQLKALKLQLQQMQGELAQLRAGIDQLEAEFDTAELRQTLRPLDLSVQRYQALYATAQNMYHLRQALRQELETVVRLRSEAQTEADATGLEAQLEALLDRCDEFADQLDTLEAQGHPSPPLLKDYEQLVQAVEALQELVDELLERA
jgi:tetratricopeptide (TPR) repeat protein